MTTALYCNEHDPRPNGGDARFAFKQAAGETIEQAVIRAAQVVIATGINKVGHFQGTNHVMANNAAFAFSDELLADLKGAEDSSAFVVAAVELLEVRKAQLGHEAQAKALDVAANDAQAGNKGMSFAFAKSAANSERGQVANCYRQMHRIAMHVPKQKVA